MKHLFRVFLRSHPQRVIEAFRSYGTPQKLYLQGRVVEDRGIQTASEGDSKWDNLLNMVKRFTSAGVPYARVRARFQETEHEIGTDKAGYFDTWIEPSKPLTSAGLWQEVGLELIEPRDKHDTPVHTIAYVLVPQEYAQFAVISDIDDTVIHTDAANVLRMVLTVFLGNVHTRLPLKGVAAFYRALFHGSAQSGVNPLFYISNSPWNLYDLLSDFFHLHDIPIGPVLFLRRWGFTRLDRLPTRKRKHKLTLAREMLERFPHLPFILIGDSGERDPEIYTELVSEYPERICAVYIHHGSRSRKRPAQIQALVDRVTHAGSTLIVADGAWRMAQHAAQQGWITAESLAPIAAELQKDTEPPNAIEQLLGLQTPEDAPTVVIAGKEENSPQTEL